MIAARHYDQPLVCRLQPLEQPLRLLQRTVRVRIALDDSQGARYCNAGTALITRRRKGQPGTLKLGRGGSWGQQGRCVAGSTTVQLMAVLLVGRTQEVPLERVLDLLLGDHVIKPPAGRDVSARWQERRGEAVGTNGWQSVRKMEV